MGWGEVIFHKLLFFVFHLLEQDFVLLEGLKNREKIVLFTGQRLPS